MKIRNLFLLIAVCLSMTSCDTLLELIEEIEGTEKEKENGSWTGMGDSENARKSTAVYDFGNGKLDVDGYEIMTLAGNGKLGTSGKMDVELLPGDNAPQVSMVLNKKGRPVLLNRSIVGSRTEMNAHTTTLAYITMYPIFAPVKDKDEFNRMTSEIEKAKGFSKFEEIVAKYIAKGEEALTPEHKDAVDAFYDVVNGMCKATGAEDTRSTRANEIQVPESGPISVKIEEQVLKIQTIMLTPGYSCKVVNSKNQVVRNFYMSARGDYALKDLWWYSSRELVYNDAASIDLSGSKNGEYRVELDRLTTEAVCELSINLLCNVLDVLGLQASKVDTSTLRAAIRVFVLNRIAAITAIVSDYKITTEEIVEFFWGVALDLLSSDTLMVAIGAAGLTALRAVAGKIAAPYAIYCALRGSANGVTRFVFAATSPLSLSFCVCKEGDKELTTCSDKVTLEMVGGEDQEGFPGENLLMPLEVKILPSNAANAATHYKVHFEAISGGKMSPEVCLTEVGGVAYSYWTLADEPEVQQVEVYVTDVVTGKHMSNSVYFTARLKKYTLSSTMGGSTDYNWYAVDRNYSVYTNCPSVEVSISPSSASWLKAEYTPGALEGRVHLTVDENREKTARSATVKLTGLDDTGKVVAEKSYVVKQEGYKEEEPEEVYELDEFYSAWTYSMAVDYRGTIKWKNIKLYRDNTWEAEVWDVVDYDNGSADIQRIGYWYGTYTSKHNDYEAAIIKRQPQLIGVYDINMKCTGTETPDYVDNFDRTASSYVGQSGTHTMQLGVSEALDNKPFLTFYLYGDPVGVNDTYLWDPTNYKKKAKGRRSRR